MLNNWSGDTPQGNDVMDFTEVITVSAVALNLAIQVNVFQRDNPTGWAPFGNSLWQDDCVYAGGFRGNLFKFNIKVYWLLLTFKKLDLSVQHK